MHDVPEGSENNILFEGMYDSIDSFLDPEVSLLLEDSFYDTIKSPPRDVVYKFSAPKAVNQPRYLSIVTGNYIIKTTNGYHDEITTKVLKVYFDSVYTTNTTNFDLFLTPQLFQIQADGGANQSVTDNIFF